MTGIVLCLGVRDLILFYAANLTQLYIVAEPKLCFKNAFSRQRYFFRKILLYTSELIEHVLRRVKIVTVMILD